MKYSFNNMYGIDLFSLFILIISSILDFFPSLILRLLSCAFQIYAVYRILSNNKVARRKEYETFRMYMNRFLSKFNKSIPDNIEPIGSSNFSMLFNSIKHAINDKRKYKTMKCPGCGKVLKLPRGKGKVIITCHRCHTEFKVKL